MHNHDCDRAGLGKSPDITNAAVENLDVINVAESISAENINVENTTVEELRSELNVLRKDVRRVSARIESTQFLSIATASILLDSERAKLESKFKARRRWIFLLTIVMYSASVLGVLWVNVQALYALLKK
jgi:hypothetical protein